MSETATLPTISKRPEPMKSDLVLSAVAHKQDVESRLGAESARLDTLNAAVTDAEKALTDHISAVADGKADADPSKMAAVADATAMRDIQFRLVGELSRRAGEAQDQHIKAIGLAHQPLYARGLAIRLKAAQDADSARVALFRAEGSHRVGTSMIQEARRHGAPDPHGDVRNMIGGRLQTGLVATEEVPAGHTEHYERQIWQGAHDGNEDTQDEGESA